MAGPRPGEKQLTTEPADIDPALAKLLTDNVALQSRLSSASSLHGVAFSIRVTASKDR